MLRWLWDSLKDALAGPRLSRAVKRNEKAADDLDAVLREVLKR